MRYEVIISPRAMKDLKSLPVEMHGRIFSMLDQLSEDPIRYVNRLKDSPLYSVHVGEYRIIINILRQKLLILVIRIGHRKNIYGKI